MILLKMTRVYTVGVNKTNVPKQFPWEEHAIAMKLSVLYVRIKMKRNHKENIFSTSVIVFELY